MKIVSAAEIAGLSGKLHEGKISKIKSPRQAGGGITASRRSISIAKGHARHEYGKRGC